MCNLIQNVFKLTGLALLLLTACGAFAEKNDHPHFRLTPNKQLDLIKPSSKVQTNLSDPASKPSMDELHYEEKNPNDFSTVVDTASFDLSKLMPSKVITLDPSEPDINFPDPKLSIDGREFILSVVESVTDHKQRVRYVTAKIVGHKGQAFFIIDDAAGEVVGNIEIDGDTYRVLPRETNHKQQLIFKTKKLAFDKHTGRSKSVPVSKPSHTSVNRLEKELLKTELLHAIEPALFRETLRAEGKSTNLIKGKIGRIDVAKTLKKDSSDVLRLLVDLDAITLARDDLEYRITQIRGSKKHGYSVRFRQVVNGIPLRSGSRIKFDSEGNVTQLSTQVIDPLITNVRSSKFSKAEVIEMAEEAIHKHLGKPGLKFITLDKIPIKLEYKVIDNNYTLTPYWELVFFEVQSGEGSYRVFIDGHTGEVKVSEAEDRITTQFQTDVCEHESGVSLPLCEDVNIYFPPINIVSTVRDVIEESSTGQFICKLSGLCQDPQAKNPWEVINNMEDWLSESTGDICCSDVGGISDSVDVKINTQESGGPSYNHGTGTISFPHPSSLDPAVWNPVQTQKIDDIVVHEATHAVIRGVNEDLSDAINDGDPWAQAINEGFSDAMAVLYSEKFDPPGDTKIGEDAFKNASDVRDISEVKTFDDFVDSTAVGMAQENGKIFGNFIYRVREAGLTIDQAAKAIVWIAETVNRNDGLIDDKLDEKDIRDAIDDISVLDQVIGAILEAVWGQMNGYEDPPSGGGGGSNTPFAPSFVTGFFTSCNGTTSLYSNSWGASAGAAFYSVYYSPSGAGYIYSFSTSFPGSLTANNIDAFVKVKACNSNGCSGLSSSTYFQPHLCGG